MCERAGDSLLSDIDSVLVRRRPCFRAASRTAAGRHVDGQRRGPQRNHRCEDDGGEPRDFRHCRREPVGIVVCPGGAQQDGGACTPEAGAAQCRGGRRDRCHADQHRCHRCREHGHPRRTGQRPGDEENLHRRQLRHRGGGSRWCRTDGSGRGGLTRRPAHHRTGEAGHHGRQHELLHGRHQRGRHGSTAGTGYQRQPRPVLR